MAKRYKLTTPSERPTPSDILMRRVKCRNDVALTRNITHILGTEIAQGPRIGAEKKETEKTVDGARPLPTDSGCLARDLLIGHLLEVADRGDCVIGRATRAHK